MISYSPLFLDTSKVMLKKNCGSLQGKQENSHGICFEVFQGTVKTHAR